MKIGELLERSGTVAPYRTLARFAAAEWGYSSSGPKVTVPVDDGEPRKEVQVDFGYLGVILLPALLKLLDRVPPRCRALVLLATFASLRFGELAGLRRGKVDLEGCGVRIVVPTAETDDGRLIDDDPKSRAGRRRVAFPKEIVPELRWHLERFAHPGDDGLVFIGPKGGRLRSGTQRARARKRAS